MLKIILSEIERTAEKRESPSAVRFCLTDHGYNVTPYRFFVIVFYVRRAKMGYEWKDCFLSDIGRTSMGKGAVVFIVCFDNLFWLVCSTKCRNRYSQDSISTAQKVWESVLIHYFKLKFSPRLKTERAATIDDNLNHRQCDLQRQPRDIEKRQTQRGYWTQNI